MYDPATALTGTEAVFAAHPDNPAIKALSTLATDAKYDRAELTITVARENVIAACQAAQQVGYNFLETVTAVDWYPSEPRFQITYHILSHSLKHKQRYEDAKYPSLGPLLYQCKMPPFQTRHRSE